MALTTVSPALLDTQAQYTGFKNRIINGAMVIDQRNAGAAVTTSALQTSVYTLDRWRYYNDVVSKRTIQQVSDAPPGFTNSLKVTVIATDTVGPQQWVSQSIEGLNLSDFGWGTANAQPAVFSFWVKSSVTGQQGGSLQSSGTASSYPFAYTVNAANTWEYKTVSVLPPTTGTFNTNNTTCCTILFENGPGYQKSSAGAWIALNASSSTGSINLCATNGATWQVTGVQLEKGSTATSFDYRPYGTELALCQRYYWKSVSGVNFNTFAIGVVDSASSCSGVYAKHPVTMRTTPTCSYSNLRLYDGTGAPAVTSLAGNWSSTESWSQGFNATAAGLTQGRACAIQANGSSTSYIDASAEL